ncbi:MAG: co-chaperone GroES [Rhodospirillaceae bacterium]|nr:co-chaperone GroES [Rhodospirillaceae bacterium]
MGFKPLHDRVLLRRVGEEEKSAGGIIIPDTAQEKPSEGIVVSVGSGVRADDGSVRELDVKAGDRVLFGKFGGTDVKVDGEDLLILRESDILGVVEGKKKTKKSA